MLEDAGEDKFNEKKIKYDEMTKLQKAITTIVDYTKPTSQNVEKLLELAKKLEKYAFRFYICDEEGFQTSPNIVSGLVVDTLKNSSLSSK